MEKSILIFSNGEKIGDGIIKLPLLHEIKRRLKNYEIVWMTDKGKTVYNSALKNNSLVYFNKPVKDKSYKYLFNNLEILIENYKNYKKMFNNSLNSISAIIDGKIVNNKGKQVIGYGEIVKTQTLKKLSNRFKIHKRITLIKVTKKNIYSRIKNNLIKIN